MKQRLAFESAAFLLAVQFLTRLPIRSGTLYSEARMAASPRYYPVVGLLIGCCAALLYALGASVLSPLSAVIASTAGICLLTGAFHEDGLADTFDGIGGGLTPEASLEIMKDSRIGTYGAAALLFMLALKISLLADMPATILVPVLIAGHGLSRASSLLAIATSNYVRLEGTGKYTANSLGGPALLFSAATAAAIILALGYSLDGSAALYCLLGALIGHAAMRAIYQSKIGGYTGDTLGALQQSSEVGIYMGIAAWL